MLAIDWAHTKDFVVYDGKKAKLLPWPEVIKKAKENDSVVIEQGAPLLYLYRLAKAVPTFTVPTVEVATERKRLGIDKDDIADAKIIWNLATSKDGLKPLTLDDDKIKLAYLYHQYLYSLKAQVATGNLMKAMKRNFGEHDNSTLDMLAEHEKEYQKHCEGLKKEIIKLAPTPPAKIIEIKGIADWLWAGIMVCADPNMFHCKAAYKKWCGFIDRKVIGYKFSRNASRCYYLCAESMMKQRTPYWRDVYDEAKEQLTNREGYTHPHGGAMNRLMTKFACFVYDVVKEENGSAG